MKAKYKCKSCGINNRQAFETGCGMGHGLPACPMEYRAIWRRWLYKLTGIIT